LDPLKTVHSLFSQTNSAPQPDSGGPKVEVNSTPQWGQQRFSDIFKISLQSG
jgi:hypothetical protein